MSEQTSNVAQATFEDYPKLPENYFYSWKSPFEKPRQRTIEEEERVQRAFFQSMQSQIGPQVPEEQRENLQKLGEKLHQSYDTTHDILSNTSTQDIFLEESLAYVSENVKAGLHPRYLNPEDVDLLRAGYGEEWYTHFGYTKEDLTE